MHLIVLSNMMNFCTYFDSNYLHKGLALYLSLEKVTKDFHLYVMAYDKECYDKLKEIGFSHMTVELWDDWESEEIKAVKGDRSRAEYCWTCGPSIIYHFLEEYKLSDITYLDSDLFFVGDPQIAFDEIGDKSVAITEQRVSEDRAQQVGRYCVQFMYFKNDEEGLAALTWWRDACIEWCYQRFEGDRYGDQKYLDRFPERYKSLCIFQNMGVGIAPWNTYNYRYTATHVIDGDKQYPSVFFHMHGLTFSAKDSVLNVDSINYDMRGESLKYFYQPYAELMKEVVASYLGWEVTSVKVNSFSPLKRLLFAIRTALRNNSVMKWLYYTVFDMSPHGHGLK